MAIFQNWQNKVTRVQGFNAKTIEGSRSMHAMRSVNHLDKMLSHVCELLCFCNHCEGDFVGVCPSTIYVKPHNLITLVPTNVDDGEAKDEDKFDVSE